MEALIGALRTRNGAVRMIKKISLACLLLLNNSLDKKPKHKLLLIQFAMMKPIIQYFGSIRGRGESIQLMLSYGNIEYDFYGFTLKEFASMKANDNLPYEQLPVMIDENGVLSQSVAIMRYLAPRCGCLPDNDFDQAIAHEIALASQDIIGGALVLNGFVQEENNDIVQNIRRQIEHRLPQIAARLGENDFFTGDQISYADFMIWSFLDIDSTVFPDILDRYDNLRAFHVRISELDAVREYLETRDV